MGAYYNEIDAKAAAWLRELISRDLIAPGEVDERSIEDIRPGELAGFTQCHFFAGIGVWSYALRQAGWSDDRSVWTGSCPCQPFSAAGKGEGFADERHLWPAWFHLISQCRPTVVLGEQVASKDGFTWLDLVYSDMEALDYAFGPTVLPAAGFGAPHGRHRIFFVADSNRVKPSDGELQRSGRLLQPAEDAPTDNLADAESRGLGINGSASRKPGHVDECESAGSVDNSEGSDGRGEQQESGTRSGRPGLAGAGATSGMAHTIGAWISGRNQRGLGTSGRQVAQPQDGPSAANESSDRGEDAGPLADADSERRQQIGRGTLGDETANGPEGRNRGKPDGDNKSASNGEDGRPGATNGFWQDVEWLYCRDGKYRPTQPGIAPLAHGVANRVVKLRGYGNAINAIVAKEFIQSYIELSREY